MDDAMLHSIYVVLFVMECNKVICITIEAQMKITFCACNICAMSTSFKPANTTGISNGGPVTNLIEPNRTLRDYCNMHASSPLTLWSFSS